MMLGRTLVIGFAVGLAVACTNSTVGPDSSEGGSPPITESETGQIVGQPVEVHSFTVEVTDEGSAMFVVTGSVPSPCHEAVLGFEEPNDDRVMIGESESWLDPGCDDAAEPTEFFETMAIDGLAPGDYVANLDGEFEASFVIPNQATSSPSTTATENPSPSDLALVDAFLEFAKQPDAETFSRLPLAESLSLGLGPQIIRMVDGESLRDPEAWVIDVAEFRAYTGPFSALELMRKPDDHTVHVGEHPHCAATAQAPPNELAGLRRVSVQPPNQSLDSCLDWTTVDFFVDQTGQVQAITMDLWEP